MRLPAVMLLVLCTVPAAAQTESVRLRAVAASDSTPLRRVRVVAVIGGRAAAPVFTDDEGRVEVAGGPGAAVLQVSKAGFAPQAVSVPTPLPGAIDVRLAPAAVITGRVVDSRGQPAVRVGVAIRRAEPGVPASGTRVRTDDRGEYRLGNLPAGRYELYTERGVDLTNVLDGLPPGGAPDAIAERRRAANEPLSDAVIVTAGPGEAADVVLTHQAPSVEFPFSEGGVVTGTLVDEYGEPAEGASLTLLALGSPGLDHMSPPVQADDLGRFRLFQIPPGRYLLAVHTASDVAAAAATAAVVRIGGPPPETSMYLPVYYPGRLDPAEATPLVIERSRELHGVDMVVPAARGVRVFGTAALPAERQRQRVGVYLRPAIRSTAAAFYFRFASVADDGAFELPNVPPGSYTLQSLVPMTTDRFGDPSAVSFAAVKIAVGADDVGPVAVTPAPTSTISGRVVLEGGRDAVSPNDFRISILPVDPAAAPEPSMIGGALMMSGGFEPGSDWKFRVTGLATPTRFGLARGPEGWWLKSVRIGGVNAALEPADFGSPDDSRDDIEIVLAPTGGMVGGRAVGGDGQRLDVYTVIAFSPDREWWFPGSPRVQTTTSRSDGNFVLPTLAPGDYNIAAVEFSEVDPDADDLRQPEALARLAAVARRVTVAEGQPQRVELQLVRDSR